MEHHTRESYGENEIYQQNDKMLQMYRCAKVLYISIVIATMSIIILYDTENTDLSGFLFFYLLFEIGSIIIYCARLIKNNHNKSLKIFNNIFRILWWGLTVYGVIMVISENNINSSLLYYASVYLFTTNCIYIAIAWCVTVHMGRVRLPTDNTDDTVADTSRRRTTMSIINEMTDIELFANLTGLSNETMCSICFDDFQNDDSIRILPCKHYYHDNCINKWFETNTTCPICRYDLIDDAQINVLSGAPQQSNTVHVNVLSVAPQQ